MQKLDRMLLAQLARLFFATLGGVVLLYLVIDFADRAHGYRGVAWGKAVLELYANKAAVVSYQLAPVALIIAAALLVTQLTRRGELIALFSLGVSPARIAAPVAAFALALGGLIFLLGEKVVVRADARAEEIQVKRFNRWGDWATYHAGASWVRGKGGRIYHLGSFHEGGFEPATVLEIVKPFRLSRRLDARRIEPAGPGRWKLTDALETRYSPESSAGGADKSTDNAGNAGTIWERRTEVLYQEFPETPADFALRSGRPRQLPWKQLIEQLHLRENLGLPSREFELALAERVAQPVQIIPSALAALGLAFWRGRGRRRMPLSNAAALGLGLSMALWATSVVGHAISLSGTLSPWLAAAGPSLLAAVISLATFLG